MEIDSKRNVYILTEDEIKITTANEWPIKMKSVLMDVLFEYHEKAVNMSVNEASEISMHHPAIVNRNYRIDTIESMLSFLVVHSAIQAAEEASL